MLDALSMLVHVAQMTGRTELFRAWEMVTMNPARAARFASAGMASSRLPRTTSTWEISSPTRART